MRVGPEAAALRTPVDRRPGVPVPGRGRAVLGEAGSGASYPISNEMITSVKKNIDIPLLVGGGISKPEIAKQKAKAGADIIVTGTAIEKEKDLKKALSELIGAIER